MQDCDEIVTITQFLPEPSSTYGEIQSLVSLMHAATGPELGPAPKYPTSVTQFEVSLMQTAPGNVGIPLLK